MPSLRPLKIWSPRAPYSLDPLEYDALAHHICFRSVYSSLVSDYKLGALQGAIAERWESNSDKSKWTFHIRVDLRFSNGDPLTPKDVALSLNRAAFVMKTKNSHSGLLEFLVGYNKMHSASVLVEGLSFDNNSVTLSFTGPIPDLLIKIGFGLYAIAHRDDFEPVSGVWIEAKKITSSGPYSLASWDSEQLVLSLRKDFSGELLLANPIHDAVYSFDQESIASADLIVDFDDSLAIPKDFQFYGPVKSAIKYVSCEGWQNKKSICCSKAIRYLLRDRFYKSLVEQNFKTTRSFFPLAIKGIEELTLPTLDSTRADLRSKTLAVSKVNPAFKSSDNFDFKTSQEAFDSAIQSMNEQFELNIEHFVPPANQPLAGEVDLRYRMTAISVDSPHHDVQFMFLSGHGIKLPDESGEIRKHIKNDHFSVQKVNEMLWEQGIIWPLGHMALGIWKRSNIKLDSYSLSMPPLDLQWVEWQ